MFDLVDAHVENVVRSGYLQDAYQEGAYARVAGYLGEVITSAFIEECKQRCHVALAPVAVACPIAWACLFLKKFLGRFPVVDGILFGGKWK